MDYIFDGEIHSFNDNYFYIIERYEYTDKFNLKRAKRKFLDKYIWYLFSVNFTAEQIEDIINNSTVHFTFEYKKPHQVGPLSPYGTYCMKFKKENR